MGFVFADLISGGGSSQKKALQAAQAAERDRQNRITTGMGQINSAFAGYDDNFYNNRAKSFLNYAMPQLAQQYQSTRNQIGFNLANRGISDSSQAQNQWSNLYQQVGQQKQGLVDQAQAQENQLRQQVQGLRGNVINTLYQTADPSQAGQGIASAISQIKQPSVYPALGNMFGNLLNQYYTSQVLNSYKNTGAGYAPSAYDDQPFSFAEPSIYSTVKG